MLSGRSVILRILDRIERGIARIEEITEITNDRSGEQAARCAIASSLAEYNQS